MKEKNQYWATLTGEELGKELMKKIDDCYKFMQSQGFTYLFRKVYTELNTVITEGSSIKNRGKNGEYKKIKINHLRSFKTNIESLVSEVRPKFNAIAVNSDFQSQSQTKLARGLLDYFLTQKRLEEVLKTAISYGLDTGRGFVSLEWAPTQGTIISVDPDTGKPVYDGDVKFSAYSQFDVIQNVHKQSDGEKWIILRKFVNKWDLMSSFPEFADEIADLSHDFKDTERNLYPYTSSYGESDSETVCLYELRHLPTESLPQGRLCQFLSEDLILIDVPLPYDNLAVFSFDCAPIPDLNFGYSPLFDLLPIFEAYNKLTSTILSNQANLGTSLVGAPKGSNVRYEQLAEGFSVLEYNQMNGTIAPINLLQTPGEIFNFVNSLESLGQKLSGVNGVRRGDPGALGANSSGAAYALFVAQSLSFNVNLTHSWNMLLENVGSSLVSILKSFATVPRLANIAGVNNSFYIQSFSKDDLSLIQRVKVQVGNPLSDTISGKLSIAQDLLSKQALTPNEYIQILNSGSIDTALDFEESQNLLIEQENESLMRGKIPPVLVTDNHVLHKSGHLILLNNPEARENPELVQSVLNHIREHDKLGMDLANAQGNISTFMDMMNPSTPKQGMAGNNGQPPIQPQGSPSLGGVRLPNMPNVAGTGEQLQAPAPVPGTNNGNIK